MENRVTIVEDTRNDPIKWAFLKRALEREGYNVIRNKLYVGDYALLHNQSICIDTKKDLMEVAQNCFQDHERFRNEMIRAKENSIKLYILINDEYIFNINGVHLFKLPRYKSTQYKRINGVSVVVHKRGETMAKFKPDVLEKTMKTMEEKYGVKFVFCKKIDTHKKILDLLGER